MGMFEVDKAGLAQVLARRGVQFAVLELIQNAFDEPNVKQISVCLIKSTTRGYFHLTVTDDAPEGFADLSHAYTLFAPSKKKDNPEQRGRFNLGEKLVLACTRSASIKTTKGTVYFENGERRHSREKTDKGSVVSVEIKMTAEEAQQTERAVKMVILPWGVELLFNDWRLQPRYVLQVDKVNLPTERADSEGFLRPTRRDTHLRTYAVNEGEQPMLFEMGIPVVELDCAWHVDIGQKVPLNMDRDNVTPAYKRQVLTTVVNMMHKELSQEQAKAPWVGEALASPDMAPEAVESVITARYGDKRVIADPSDPEGTKLAVSQGYNVIPAGSFSKEQWSTIRNSGAAKPAGQVTPSPKPFHAGGEPLKTLSVEKYKEGHRHFEHYAKCVADELLGVDIEVVFANDFNWGFAGAFGPQGTLYVNLRGHKSWFEPEMSASRLVEIDEFLIHEFAHHKVRDHLSSAFHEECCRLGALLTLAAREDKLNLSMFDAEIPFG